jgi:hypothetical protein
MIAACDHRVSSPCPLPCPPRCCPRELIAISRTGDKLYGQATGQPRFRLHATSQRDFAVHVVPASVTFEVDAKGKVTGLVLHQNGHDQRAPRQ